MLIGLELSRVVNSFWRILEFTPIIIWQSEMKVELDRFAREKKELSEQIQEVESQLEWLRSERDDEIKKLNAEKKVLQDRLHDAETQISQLKSRKRDELKVLITFYPWHPACCSLIFFVIFIATVAKWSYGSTPKFVVM